MDTLRDVLAYIWDASWVGRVRRNHAIEHATIHLLSARLPYVRMAGRSTANGFYIYGNIPTDVLERTVHEAIARLQAGESRLALHPHCGTNLVTASILAGIATVLASAGHKRRWWDKLLTALSATTIALAAAQPLGYWAQEHITTEATLRGAEVIHIRRLTSMGQPAHFVRIRYHS